MKKYNVNFINQNITIKAEENATVSDICQEAGFPLDMVCSGKGTCGKCQIEIEKDGEKSVVLACQTKVSNSMNIYLTEHDYSKKSKILSNMKEGLTFNPSLKKTYRSIKDIKKQREEFLRDCDLYVLRKFSSMLNEKGLKGITFVEYENKIIDVQRGDTCEFLYGAAVDIGTTTVVLYIYDMNNGHLLNTYSEINSQISVGADVISRISLASDEEGLKELNGKIIYTLNNLVNKAKIEVPFLLDNLYNIFLCGNSTMQHLFFNFRPDRLGVSPFLSITKDYVECFGKETGLSCPDRCRIVFLPLLGGFVGADTTAVLIAAGDDSRLKLIVDLGTNGEIAVGNIDGWLVASTACGPALEGGNIEYGMRATVGAVEKFKIENDEISIKVIGDTEPLGICGSGIIDITAQLLKNNLIDRTGRMLTSDEYMKINTNSILCRNLRNIDGINSFVIYDNEKKSVYITQKDIRQVQLAKSSICSGCMTLLKASGMEVYDIDEVLVAGAFGNYIDLENALYIGLLPQDLPKIEFMGNGAGRGASMLLLDKDSRRICDKISENTTHYELADDKYYAGIYIDNMNF